VAPLATGLIALDTRSATEAHGRFLSTAGYFMPLRAAVDGVSTLADPKPTPASETKRPTALNARDTFYHQDLRFLLTVAIPGITVGQHGPYLDDLIIRDRTGSWAKLEQSDDGSFHVTEGGIRKLWSEVESVHNAWHEYQRPSRERFGLSVNGTRQWIWLDNPDNSATWELAAHGVGWRTKS
jgi:hypothetical protein